MSETNVKVKVISATPGADSNTYNQFDSTVSFGGGLIQSKNLARLEYALNNSGAGTLRFYKSIDKGTTWRQVGGDIAVLASSSTDITGPYDFLIDSYWDVKLDWINGGSAQTTWEPSIVLIPVFRAPAI